MFDADITTAEALAALSRPEDGIVVVSGTAPHHAAWRSGLRGLGVPRWAS